MAGLKVFKKFVLTFVIASEDIVCILLEVSLISSLDVSRLDEYEVDAFTIVWVTCLLVLTLDMCRNFLFVRYIMLDKSDKVDTVGANVEYNKFKDDVSETVVMKESGQHTLMMKD